MTQDRFLATDSAQAISEEDIVNRVRAGETGLYGILMTRYHRRLASVAGGILKNEAEVEDALQEAHLHALTRLDQFEGRSSFLTWLTRITINEALSRLRSRPQFEPLETELPDGSVAINCVSPLPSPEDVVIGKDLHRKLQAAVNTLPRHYRAVFYKREIDDLSTTEAAQQLGISDECVKTRLHRARTLMRQKVPTPSGPVRPRPAEAERAAPCPN